MLDEPIQLPLQCNLVITRVKGKPMLEIRRRIVDVNIIKTLVLCGLRENPVIVMPKFSDKIRSISHLIQLDIVYYDKEKQQYFFKE